MIPKRIPKAYSIWLIPNGEKYILLKNTIIDLSHIFNGINFIPHVTVVSNLDYSEKFLSKIIVFNLLLFKQRVAGSNPAQVNENNTISF